jgi:hypothetical protein
MKFTNQVYYWIFWYWKWTVESTVGKIIITIISVILPEPDGNVHLQKDKFQNSALSLRKYKCIISEEFSKECVHNLLTIPYMSRFWYQKFRTVNTLSAEFVSTNRIILSAKEYYEIWEEKTMFFLHRRIQIWGHTFCTERIIPLILPIGRYFVAKCFLASQDLNSLLYSTF